MFGSKVNSRSLVYQPDAQMYGDNRARLVAALKASDAETPAGSVIVMNGSPEVNRNDTDNEPLFRQESFFLWATGVEIPDCWAAIEVDTGRTTIFVPRLPPVYAVWMGRIKSCEELAALFKCEQVRYVDELPAVLGELAAPKVFLRHGKNTDSGAVYNPEFPEGLSKEDPKVDLAALQPVIVECRVHKSEAEVAMMRAMNIAASEGHLAMMHDVGAAKYEFQLEAVFKAYCQYHAGARYAAYTYICASGPNGAVLHYGHAGAPNDRKIGADELVLCDCGHELHGYASDITTTFPSTGKFTADQRAIYEAVLDAHTAVIETIKPGVNWPDMQTLAYERILTGLKAIGVVKGDLAAMMEANVGATFMPHGLGHLIGLDTHDVGGYPEGGPKRSTKAGYKSLRLGRVLEERMVLTVEPGCYFNEALLEAARADETLAQFIDFDVIEARFKDMGGVRLEDNILITADGRESFTRVPRTVEEIEAACAGTLTDIGSIASAKHSRPLDEVVAELQAASTAAEAAAAAGGGSA